MGQVKYCSSFRYSGKLKVLVVGKGAFNTLIVQPTHMLGVDGREVELKSNEIDLLEFGPEGLHNCYDDVVEGVKAKIVNR